MYISNWESGKGQSNYHFTWDRHELAGHDYRWVTCISADWYTELEYIKQEAKPKTWGSRGKQYHPEHPDLIAEENDLVNAGMSKDAVIFRKYFDFEGIWAKLIESFGMTDTKQAFHIQYPGEMLNLHIDKQYEMNEDANKVARFFIFLEDWKPGQFMHMGTSFLQWRRGDVVWFDWRNMPHASANAGWEPRCLIQLTGTMTDITEKILLGTHKIKI
jgi:hypothetical protein